jgi:glycosyltransferase involved in cell wall biosynthesis
VVVSGLGGMAELVTDEVTGYQFDAGNARDLARVLQQFLDRPTLVDHLRQQMPVVKSVEEEIGELLEAYASLEGESIA